MSKVALASIKSLTFYEDALTTARRTEPIAQLNCLGKGCSLYTPEVVRCTNVGGQGTDIDWKCEADLPEALRFGRVEVSCEGWSGPGDPFVLKGSCALNYRLVQVPDALRNQNEAHGTPSYLPRWLHTQDISGAIFMLLWWILVLYIVYQIVKSCLTGSRRMTSPTSRQGGPGGGWTSFPGTQGGNDRYDPPPPYSKSTNPAGTYAARENWQPGFWTGAAAGGLGTYLLSRNRRQDTSEQRTYDWERRNRGQQFSPSFYSSSRRAACADDRGEGFSSGTGLGSMRRSTGLGGSSVR